jgi:hypothetical protein
MSASGAEQPAEAERSRWTHAPGRQRAVRRALHAGVRLDFHELVENGRAEGGERAADDRVQQQPEVETRGARSQKPTKVVTMTSALRRNFVRVSRSRVVMG